MHLPRALGKVWANHTLNSCLRLTSGLPILSAFGNCRVQCAYAAKFCRVEAALTNPRRVAFFLSA